jgi:8-oxo-dGTP diphosphatase
MNHLSSGDEPPETEARFCLRCGSPLIQAERFGRIRPVCPRCGWIYFHDPKVAVAALIEDKGRILLVRRSMDPERGKWTLPAGFLDANEDPIRAVARECLEETGLQVRVTQLLDVLFGQEHPRGAHLLLVYRAEIISGELRAGDDADRAEFFDVDHLPPLAFATTKRILSRVNQVS